MISAGIRATDLISKKRKGGSLSAEEITRLIDAYATGGLPDYQMAAWLMAVCCSGLSTAETKALTQALVRSGATLDLSTIGPAVGDKHSTGGVGDKVTLILAPLVAACGLPFAKISGRGLGHTGGTIDKLESIPGFRTDLGSGDIHRQLSSVGVVVAQQGPELVPADALLYALRDATATVDNDGLIAASIMSKKIAAGATAVILDVKVGEGALTGDRARAHGLAELMIEIGTDAGLRTGALLTSMQKPLGAAVGNALEVQEAISVLRGAVSTPISEPLTGVVLALAGKLLALAGIESSSSAGRGRAARVLSSGWALETFRRWMVAQGARPEVAEGKGLPRAPVTLAVRARSSGYIQHIGALPIGKAASLLGAGRETKDGAVDPAVGVMVVQRRANEVDKGEVLAVIHARSEAAAADVEGLVAGAFVIGQERPPAEDIILEEI